MYQNVSSRLWLVGAATGNEKLTMLSRLLLCRGTVVNSTGQTLLSRNVSQTFLSLKPKLTRALHLTRDAPLFSLSKLRVSNLSVCKRNGAATFPKGKRFAPVEQKEKVHLDVNTNIANNIFLYKYERPKYFKYLNGFAVFQFLFWLGLCYVVLSQFSTRNPEESLKEYLLKNFPMGIVGASAILLGTGSAILIWAFTSKSVRYVILHKGGKDVTFVTYHPLNKNVSTTVSIDDLRCKWARSQMKNYLPIKIQGRPFYYILDSSGEFINPILFDHSVGVMRF